MSQLRKSSRSSLNVDPIIEHISPSPIAAASSSSSSSSASLLRSILCESPSVASSSGTISRSSSVLSSIRNLRGTLRQCPNDLISPSAIILPSEADGYCAPSSFVLSILVPIAVNTPIDEVTQSYGDSYEMMAAVRRLTESYNSYHGQLHPLVEADWSKSDPSLPSMDAMRLQKIDAYNPTRMGEWNLTQLLREYYDCYKTGDETDTNWFVKPVYANGGSMRGSIPDTIAAGISRWFVSIVRHVRMMLCLCLRGVDEFANPGQLKDEAKKKMCQSLLTFVRQDNEWLELDQVYIMAILFGVRLKMLRRFPVQHDATQTWTNISAKLQQHSLQQVPATAKKEAFYKSQRSVRHAAYAVVSNAVRLRWERKRDIIPATMVLDGIHFYYIVADDTSTRYEFDSSTSDDMDIDDPVDVSVPVSLFNAVAGLCDDIWNLMQQQSMTELIQIILLRKMAFIVDPSIDKADANEKQCRWNNAPSTVRRLFAQYLKSKFDLTSGDTLQMIEQANNTSEKLCHKLSLNCHVFRTNSDCDWWLEQCRLNSTDFVWWARFGFIQKERRRWATLTAAQQRAFIVSEPLFGKNARRAQKDIVWRTRFESILPPVSKPADAQQSVVSDDSIDVVPIMMSIQQEAVSQPAAVASSSIASRSVGSPATRPSSAASSSIAGRRATRGGAIVNKLSANSAAAAAVSVNYVDDIDSFTMPIPKNSSGAFLSVKKLLSNFKNGGIGLFASEHHTDYTVRLPVYGTLVTAERHVFLRSIIQTSGRPMDMHQLTAGEREYVLAARKGIERALCIDELQGRYSRLLVSDHCHVAYINSSHATELGSNTLIKSPFPTIELNAAPVWTKFDDDDQDYECWMMSDEIDSVVMNTEIVFNYSTTENALKASHSIHTLTPPSQHKQNNRAKRKHIKQEELTDEQQRVKDKYVHEDDADMKSSRQDGTQRKHTAAMIRAANRRNANSAMEDCASSSSSSAPASSSSSSAPASSSSSSSSNDTVKVSGTLYAGLALDNAPLITLADDPIRMLDEYDFALVQPTMWSDEYDEAMRANEINGTKLMERKELYAKLAQVIEENDACSEKIPGGIDQRYIKEKLKEAGLLDAWHDLIRFYCTRLGICEDDVMFVHSEKGLVSVFGFGHQAYHTDSNAGTQESKRYTVLIYLSSWSRCTSVPRFSPDMISTAKGDEQFMRDQAHLLSPEWFHSRMVPCGAILFLKQSLFHHGVKLDDMDEKGEHALEKRVALYSYFSDNAVGGEDKNQYFVWQYMHDAFGADSDEFYNSLMEYKHERPWLRHTKAYNAIVRKALKDGLAKRVLEANDVDARVEQTAALELIEEQIEIERLKRQRTV